MTALRTPALQVLADGAPVPGVLAAQVNANSHHAAGTWRVRLASSADPAGLSAWDTRTASLIDIQIGIDGGWTSLMTGRIDTLRADAVDGIVTIEGRDLSASFIEARMREVFANQTASDIAATLAARHGLAAAITPTTTPVGRYYSDTHDRTTLDRHADASTEWDLLVWLAREEGFDVFVEASTLVFQPPQQAAAAMVLQAASLGPVAPNLTALVLQRRMALAGPVEVTVKSWNSQTQTALVQTARDNDEAASGGSGSAPRSFIYLRPNLAADAAQALAAQKLAALIAHRYVVTATMPGEVTLMPRSVVTLTGTGSAFDQSYVIDEIERRFDARLGFTQILRARSSGSA